MVKYLVASILSVTQKRNERTKIRVLFWRQSWTSLDGGFPVWIVMVEILQHSRSAIFTFPQERLKLEKERSSGMYRLSAYFMARTVGDLPMELVLPSIFTVITYWMAGLKLSAGSFFATLFSLLFNVLVSQGLGLATGAMFMDQKSATVLGSVIILCFTLAGGYFVQQVPSFIAWIKYISITQYAYKLLLVSQYSPGETYSCGINATCLIEKFPSIKTTGLGGKGISAVALAIMLLGYRFLAYAALKRIGVTKK